MFKLGEKVTIEGKDYIVSKGRQDGQCLKCDLVNKGLKWCSDFLRENDDYCAGPYRKDRNFIVFKEVEDVDNSRK